MEAKKKKKKKDWSVSRLVLTTATKNKHINSVIRLTIMCVCMCMCASVYMCVHVCVCVCVFTVLCVFVSACVCRCVCVCVWLCACAHTKKSISVLSQYHSHYQFPKMNCYLNFYHGNLPLLKNNENRMIFVVVDVFPTLINKLDSQFQQKQEPRQWVASRTVNASGLINIIFS